MKKILVLLIVLLIGITYTALPVFADTPIQVSSISTISEVEETGMTLRTTVSRAYYVDPQNHSTGFTVSHKVTTNLFLLNGNGTWQHVLGYFIEGNKILDEYGEFYFMHRSDSILIPSDTPKGTLNYKIHTYQIPVSGTSTMSVQNSINYHIQSNEDLMNYYLGSQNSFKTFYPYQFVEKNMNNKWYDSFDMLKTGRMLQIDFNSIFANQYNVTFTYKYHPECYLYSPTGYCNMINIRVIEVKDISLWYNVFVDNFSYSYDTDLHYDSHFDTAVGFHTVETSSNLVVDITGDITFGCSLVPSTVPVSCSGPGFTITPSVQSITSYNHQIINENRFVYKRDFKIGSDNLMIYDKTRFTYFDGSIVKDNEYMLYVKPTNPTPGTC